ncbi:MAG: dihydroneopterin aldolase [Bacillota bacterium]
MSSRDRILITGMQFYGHHGVHDLEQKNGQVFTVDVEIYLDLRPAGESDRLDRTVDYSKVYREVRQIVEGQTYRLIEAVAEAVARRLLQAFPRIEEVVVRVHKPRAPLPGTFADVAVEVRRTRE